MEKLNTLPFDRVLMGGIQEMVFIIRVEEEDFYYEYLNRTAMDRTGLDETVTGKSIRSIYPAEKAAFLCNYYREAIETRTPLTYEDSYIAYSGEWYYSEVKLTPMFDEKGKGSHIVALVQDITGRKKSERELISSRAKLRESEKQFRIIAENSSDLITLLDRNGRINYVSPSYEEVLGFDHEEYLGKHYSHNVHPDDMDKVEKTYSEAVENNQNWHIQFRQKNSSGDWLWSELRGAPVFDEEDHFLYMVVVTRDIALRKKYEAKLKHFAYHDSLTGLPNRRFFKKCLADELKAFEEGMDRFAVIMLDIDHFKDINDSMGHDVGDEVIEEFGRRLKLSIRDTDIVARLGGDEFIILLPGVGSAHNAVKIAEKMKTSLQYPWKIKQYKLPLTTSIGIALPSLQGDTVSNILKNADISLYEVKESGRNNIGVPTFSFTSENHKSDI
ncbi:diguanylate cyclase domain-containing protein [Virgibacillus doumboii]|uniref:diguanylate cyclase domain-containing protein n=1 Tax=Virgibacillus doumboii TaxID=2697503 RepID=UPI0013DF3161|nr:diguanylate cyclase [Virgibacillus doumboii]